MKKNVIPFVVVAFSSVVGYNVQKEQGAEKLSDIALMNIEALAGDESVYDYKKPQTVSCDLREGPWHTASVERVCDFSAVPSSCTPVEYGGDFN